MHTSFENLRTIAAFNSFPQRTMASPAWQDDIVLCSRNGAEDFEHVVTNPAGIVVYLSLGHIYLVAIFFHALLALG